MDEPFNEICSTFSDRNRLQLLIDKAREWGDERHAYGLRRREREAERARWFAEEIPSRPELRDPDVPPDGKFVWSYDLIPAPQKKALMPQPVIARVWGWVPLVLEEDELHGEDSEAECCARTLARVFALTRLEKSTPEALAVEVFPEAGAGADFRRANDGSLTRRAFARMIEAAAGTELTAKERLEWGTVRGVINGDDNIEWEPKTRLQTRLEKILHDGDATTREAEEALSSVSDNGDTCDISTIRRALDSMVEAGVALKSDGRPATYSLTQRYRESLNS